MSLCRVFERKRYIGTCAKSLLAAACFLAMDVSHLNTVYIALMLLVIVCYLCVFCPCSAEIDQKLQEIMKQTGYLKIDGQVRCAFKQSFFGHEIFIFHMSGFFWCSYLLQPSLYHSQCQPGFDDAGEDDSTHCITPHCLYFLSLAQRVVRASTQWDATYSFSVTKDSF